MSANLSSIYSEFNLNVVKDEEKTGYVFEDYRLDAARLMLYRDEKEISLPPKAIETLLVLVENQGSIVGKEDLIQKVWADTIVEESNLSHYLYVLRKTLGATREGKPFIETFRRRGYRFNGEVRLLDSLPPKNGSAPPTVRTSVAPHRTVERHGNVLKLVDWQAENPTEVVSGDDAANASAPSKQLSIGKAAIIAVFALVLAASLFYAGSRILPPARPAANAKGELTILRLTNGIVPFDATISADGNYFVYHEYDGKLFHLWLQQTGGSSRIEIIPPSERILSSKTFSPDGGFVYFVGQDKLDVPRSLYRVPTLGGVQSKILDDIISPVSFSPDGKEIVFRRLNEKTGDSALIIANSDGGSQRILLARTGEQGMLVDPAWSPDGNLIAFGDIYTQSQGSCTIVGINPHTGASLKLSPEKWDNCLRMAWTRDGQGLVFIGTKFAEGLSPRRDQIYYLSYPSGEARRLTTDGSRHQVVSLGVTDNNEILAVPFNRSSQIWQMNPSGDARTAVQITNGLADGRAGLAPLADGRVGYIARTGDNLNVWLANADGTNQKQILNDPPAVEELRASPDGRFFVFSAPRDGFAHLFLIDADGANLRQLTFGNSNDIDSTVSPDGNWIIYDSTVFKGGFVKEVLRKVSSSGGEPVLLTDKKCTNPHFSPDGRFVSCVYDNNKLAVISAEDGSIVKTFETVKYAILNFGARWSPDGQSLVYIVQQNNFNLWQQPIDGSAARPLTDFTSGEIYNFAFSNDGSCLYVARGYSIRDAVLIKNFK